MPMISVQVAGEPSTRLARAIAEKVRDLTAEFLGKDPRLTAVAVDFVPKDHWFVGGHSAAETATSAFFVHVRITDGTNTKDEKARYVDRTFHALSELLGGVHEESYVHVDDARADAYGYGGMTQERRYIAARPLGGRA